MPEKNGFLKFWEIAWAKRFKLIALNFMYFIPNIISVILAGLSYNVATSMYFTLSSQERISEVSENASDISSAPGAGFSNELFVKTLLFVVILFTVLPVFAAGPFRSGFAYILRSFTKREPCFLWTDYIGKTRSNLKFSLIASLAHAQLLDGLCHVQPFR